MRNYIIGVVLLAACGVVFWFALDKPKPEYERATVKVIAMVGEYPDIVTLVEVTRPEFVAGVRAAIKGRVIGIAGEEITIGFNIHDKGEEGQAAKIIRYKKQEAQVKEQ